MLNPPAAVNWVTDYNVGLHLSYPAGFPLYYLYILVLFERILYLPYIVEITRNKKIHDDH